MASENDQASEPAQLAPGGFRFWAIILSLLVTTFLSALDLTAISNALPTIASKLHIEEFAWIGSSFALASTACMPWFAGLTVIFGRRGPLVVSILLFAAGSALCGAANGLAMMLAGRAISGIGGGGILTITDFLMADLIPLDKRGPFIGLFALAWSFASAAGPPIGGAFASAGDNGFRWLFYMNLPLCGISLLLVLLFLNFEVPTVPFREKIRRIDWVGTFVFVISITLIVFALTSGGAAYSWSSAAVLVSLILGLAALPLFAIIEWRYTKEPTVPIDLLSDRSVVIGYATTFLHGILTMCIIYYLPVYFQAVKSQTPIRSGISLFSLCFTIAPFAIVTGIFVSWRKRYKPSNLLGWMVTILGFGLMTLISTGSLPSVWIATPLVTGIGLGLLYTATAFVVQAPLPVELAAHALAFHAFSRSLGQVFGVTLGSVILQNILRQELPDAIGRPSDIALVVIPYIKSLEEPLQQVVKDAYTHALRWIWIVSAIIAGISLLMACFIREVPMHTTTDERFAYKGRQQAQEEAQVMREGS